METITAEQLIILWQTASLPAVLINLVAFKCGVLLHVLKTMKQDKITFFDYWRSHAGRSLASIATLSVAFIALQVAGDSPLYAYFSIAYLGDSLVNKSPVSG